MYKITYRKPYARKSTEFITDRFATAIHMQRLLAKRGFKVTRQRVPA